MEIKIKAVHYWCLINSAQPSLSSTVSRVMSFKTVIYLGYMSPYTSSVLPESWRAAIKILHGLASDGVYNAFSVARGPVVSYTAISPLPQRMRRYTFCCTFLRITPTWRYQASCPVKPGLSSPAKKCGSDRSCCSPHSIQNKDLLRKAKLFSRKSRAIAK